MSDYAKTGMFVGGAAVLVAIAMFTGPKPVKQEAFKDEGEVLFPQFTDPLAAAELEVTEFRDATSAVYRFSVKKDDQGRWIIPSHDGYLADAKQRMGEAAAMMIGMKKDRVRSDDKAQHAQFEVVDPSDGNTAETKGRGRLVRMKDKAGNTLAELIIGKAVEGKTDAHYVRIPEKRRVYESKFDDKVSAKFADWIETDLLKAQAWDMTEVLFDNYKVDEQQGSITQGEKILAKKDDASKWTVDGITAEEQANEEKLNEVTRTLGEIKIVGVRRKPEGLTAALKQKSGVDPRMLQAAIGPMGYYVTRTGDLVSNEGDLVVRTKKGLVYTLRFGQVAPGEGDELTAGKADPQAKPKDGKEATATPASHRFLMVTVDFDPKLLTPPKGLRLADEVLKQRSEARMAIDVMVRAVDDWRSKHDKKLPESLAKLTEKPAEGEPPLKELKKDPWGEDYVLDVTGDTFVVRSKGPDKKDGGEGADADVRSDKINDEEQLKIAADDWKSHDKKIEDGKKEAETLGKRFGDWYYVISAELFGKLKPARKDVVKAKDKPADKPADGPLPPVQPAVLPGGNGGK